MTGWLALAALAATLVAVGEALVRPLVRERLRAAMPSSERFAVGVMLGVAALTWWGVVLAQAGVFSAPTLLAPPATLAVATLAVRRWRRRHATRVRRAGSMRRLDAGGWAVLAALCAVGAFLYFPPFDVRLEARDPGTYYLTGVQFAKKGAIAITDPAIDFVPAADRDFWFRDYRAYSEVLALRFMGFFLENRDTGRVVPQALPTLPAWIGFGYATGGAPWALRATCVLAIFASCCVFVLGRRWLGLFGGAVGAGLIAISLPQVWFAKFAAAEIVAQAFLAAGAFGWLMFRRHRDAAFGLLAAAGFGLSWLTKAELAVLALPLAMAFGVDLVRGRVDRRSLWLWLPAAAMVMHTVVYARFWAYPYYTDLASQASVRLRDPLHQAVLVAAGLIAAAMPAVLVLAARALPASWRSRGPRAARWLPWIVGVASAAGLAWGYWVRPLAFIERMQRENRYVTTWEHFNVVEMSWVLSIPVLVLAPLGAAVLMRNALRGRGSPVWTLGPFVPASIWRRQIWGYIPWAYRRWLTFVLPMMTLAFAAALATLATAGQRRLRHGGGTNVALGVAALAIVAVALSSATAAVWAQTDRYREHQELPGTLQLLVDLLDALPPESLVLFETRTHRGLTRWEAVLDVERDRHVLRLPQGTIPIEYLRRLLRLQLREGRPTYFLTTGLINTGARLSGTPVREIEFQTQRLRDLGTDRMLWEGLPLQPPTLTEPQRFRFRIYELDPIATAPDLDGELDVGEWDDLYLDGPTLHEAERDAEGRTYRWTNGRSGFYLPGMRTGAQELIVEADADTPLALPAQTMHVSLDGVLLGDVTLVEGWTPYRFELPADWRPGDTAPYVEVRAPAFRPVEHDPLSTDERPLAVKVSSIRWQ